MDSKLSNDLKMEILSRTSLVSFDAMRCTNNEYNTLSYDSNLLDLCSQRNNNVSGLIIQQHIGKFHYLKEFAPISSHGLRLNCLRIHTRIQASSEHGIIVLECPFTSWSRLSYHVSEPAKTMEILELPLLETSNLETEMVAVVVMNSTSTPMHYKIIRLSRPSHADSLEEPQFTTYYCQIFDSRTWEWRQQKPILSSYKILLNGPPITAMGSIYILQSNNRILKFDAYSNNWSTFSSPVTPLNFQFYSAMKLTKYQGKLAFVCKQLYGFWEIWVLKMNKSWEKFYVLNKGEVIGRMTFLAFYDSDTIVMLDDKTLVFYKFKIDNIINRMKLKSSPNKMNMFIYRSDIKPDVIPK